MKWTQLNNILTILLPRAFAILYICPFPGGSIDKYILVQKMPLPCAKIYLPVEVTRTSCRNSYHNKFTNIRPPNLWIAIKTGRPHHISAKRLEDDWSVSNCYICSEKFVTCKVQTFNIYRSWCTAPKILETVISIRGTLNDYWFHNRPRSAWYTFMIRWTDENIKNQVPTKLQGFPNCWSRILFQYLLLASGSTCDETLPRDSSSFFSLTFICNVTCYRVAT